MGWILKLSLNVELNSELYIVKSNPGSWPWMLKKLEKLTDGLVQNPPMFIHLGLAQLPSIMGWAEVRWAWPKMSSKYCLTGVGLSILSTAMRVSNCMSNRFYMERAVYPWFIIFSRILQSPQKWTWYLLKMKIRIL